MSKDSGFPRWSKADKAIRAAEQETARIVASGICPSCGSQIKRNLALSGWYQCVQFGAVGFRREANKPQCNWQGFTE